MLENLKPQPKIETSPSFRPSIEFDGLEGTATTEGLQDQPNFDDFLLERGYPPEEYEIVGTPRTSQWQRYDGDWLTSYRFSFRRRNSVIDLPTLFAQAKRTKRTERKKSYTDKVFVIVPSDYQVGKTGSRGGTKELFERIFESYDRIEEQMKKGKYESILILDAGDIIESVSNAADMHQLSENDLSPMQQVDAAAALQWELLKRASKYAPVTYASVGSNHCQLRVNKQTVGRPGVDDWGIVIMQQLHRLATEVGLDIKFLKPQPEDESLAYDVFGDSFHIIGLWHGHQSKRPEGVPTWWANQAFGSQPVAAASIAVTGHFHHTRVQQMGEHPNKGSRWWIQASTMDAGSDWYRRISGQDSTPAITCFELEKETHFQGAIMRL
jgi:hypothetical protein|tara:strand:- start:1107 stop:2252 length:1146 start_codon:yes stop_codon:yes gene_type:complete